MKKMSQRAQKKEKFEPIKNIDFKNFKNVRELCQCKGVRLFPLNNDKLNGLQDNKTYPLALRKAKVAIRMHHVKSNIIVAERTERSKDKMDVTERHYFFLAHDGKSLEYITGDEINENGYRFQYCNKRHITDGNVLLFTNTSRKKDRNIDFWKLYEPNNSTVTRFSLDHPKEHADDIVSTTIAFKDVQRSVTLPGEFVPVKPSFRLFKGSKKYCLIDTSGMPHYFTAKGDDSREGILNIKEYKVGDAVLTIVYKGEEVVYAVNGEREFLNKNSFDDYVNSINESDFVKRLDNTELFDEKLKLAIEEAKELFNDTFMTGKWMEKSQEIRSILKQKANLARALAKNNYLQGQARAAQEEYNRLLGLVR